MLMRSLLPALVDRAVMRPERLVDSWFDGLFDDSFFAPISMQTAAFSPAVDVTETDDLYTVRLEIPGVEAKDVAVEYQGDTLTVRGEKRLEHQAGENGARWFESRHGSFVRAFRLGKPVDAEKIAAELKNGVLMVKLPKSPEAKPRRIEIAQATAEIGPSPAPAAIEQKSSQAAAAGPA
jgi:HSP20 family protein